MLMNTVMSTAVLCDCVAPVGQKSGELIDWKDFLVHEIRAGSLPANLRQGPFK